MGGIKIAVGYARTFGYVNPKASIPNQINAIKEYCQKNSILLMDIFVDEQKTGTTTEGRSNYIQLKKVVETQKIDMVIVSFFDRLARDSYEFIISLWSFKNKGISVVSISEDSSSQTMSPIQIAMSGILVELENKQGQKDF